MTAMIRSALLLTIAVTLGACAEYAPTGWDKPGIDQDQWAINRANCHSRAQRLAEDEYMANAPMSSGAGVNTGAAFESQMRRYDARRNKQKLFEKCLRWLGYKPVRAQP